MRCNIPSGNCISCFQAAYVKKVGFSLSNIWYTSVEKWCLVYLPPTATSCLLTGATAPLHPQYQGPTELIKPISSNAAFSENLALTQGRQKINLTGSPAFWCTDAGIIETRLSKLNLKAAMHDFCQTSPIKSHLSVFKKTPTYLN